MKDALVCSLSAVNPIRPLILWRQSSLSYFVLCQSSYVVPSPLIMALSSRTITASINYRCAPFSATLMHRGRRAALKTPSDACAEDCRGKLIWPRCPINACSPWCVPIITLRESVLTTKPRQRFSAVTCCTSNVDPPPENHRVELRHPKSAAVFPVHFDLSVRSPLGDHPKLTGRVVGAMPEIATGGAKENLVIVGNAFRKKHVLKCLKRRSGEGIDADDFVLRRDWLRQQKSH